MIVSTLLAAALAVAVPPQRTDAPRPFAIQADKVLLGDGRAIENGVILVEGGVIRAVGAGVEVPRNASLHVHKGVASAGMIAMHSFSGAATGLRDSTRPVMPGVEIALAFDPEHEDFSKALAAGITSVVLTPPPQSLAGGVSALVKTSGGHIVTRNAQLSLGFSGQSLSTNKFPTSYSEALAELDRQFAKPTGAIAQAVSGKLPVLLETTTRQDVQRALAFAVKHKLSGAINGAAWAGELAAEIRESKLAVVCGPLDIGEDARSLRAVRALADAGIPFGFGLDAPWKDPAALRFGAALCVRAGLAPAAAWRGLTSGAAQILGVGDRIGSLERGREADIVLWSGDPLELASTVEAVYVDGVCVIGAER